MTNDTNARFLVQMRLRHDQEAAAARASAPRQEPLPFDDGFLDGPTEAIEYHGTTVGLRLHAENDEPPCGPCGPCAEFLTELADAGLVRPLKGAMTMHAVEAAGITGEQP